MLQNSRDGGFATLFLMCPRGPTTLDVVVWVPLNVSITLEMISHTFEQYDLSKTLEVSIYLAVELDVLFCVQFSPSQASPLFFLLIRDPALRKSCKRIHVAALRGKRAANEPLLCRS